ncbi:MAG: T9SS type A sorting domain-containing protein [Fluviicola sp.]|nr:T9SS type A sorting domain-containing protein [Fluviicola sp.]
MKRLLFLFLGLTWILSANNYSTAQCLVPAMVWNTPTATTNSITATYPTVPGAAWYEFQYKQSSSGTWISAGTLSAGLTSKTFTGLLTSTSYDIRGRSMCSGGTAGVWSTILTQSTTSPLACELPAVLSQSAITNTSATFTWPAIAGAGWYEFRYKLVSSGTWISGGTIAAPGTSKTQAGLAAYSNYEIQTRTFCNTSQYSNWSSSTLFTTTVNPPTLSASTVNSNNATVTWTAVPNALWYELKIKPATGPWVSAGTMTGSATSKVFTGLAANVSYQVQARTFGPGSVASPWGTILNFTTISPVDCQTPPSISASTINATNATISWPAVNLAAWYEIEYKTAASGTWIYAGTLGSSATSKILNNLTGNTNYNVRARTYCSNGLASNWMTLNFTTITAAGCELPPVIALDSTNASTAFISWPAVVGVAWYEFRYKLTSSGTWISAGTLSSTGIKKVLTGLSASSTYDFQARSFCSNGQPSAWSTVLQFTTGSSAIGTRPVVTAEQSSTEKSEAIAADFNQEVLIFPNPTNGLINLETTFEIASTNVVVRVVDMTGRVVLEKTNMAEEGVNTFLVNLSDLNAGMYAVELYNNSAFINRSSILKK